MEKLTSDGMQAAASLSQKKLRGLEAILSERTIADAAKKTGISRQVLYEWMQEPAFAAALREARVAAFTYTITRLQQLSEKALSVLEDNLDNVNTPPATRVRAAEVVLSHAAKGLEAVDILTRLEQLEEAVHAT